MHLVNLLANSQPPAWWYPECAQRPASSSVSSHMTTPLHTNAPSDAASMSFYGHPPALHSAIHPGWQAAEVGSLLELATAALLQELNAFWQIFTKATHVILLVNSCSHTLQPGDELLWALLPRPRWKRPTQFQTDPSNCRLMQQHVR